MLQRNQILNKWKQIIVYETTYDYFALNLKKTDMWVPLDTWLWDQSWQVGHECRSYKFVTFVYLCHDVY